MMAARIFGKPLVASLCGTFLKPEMLSVYRQITGLKRHKTIVFTERRTHEERFPFEPVVVMQKPPPEVRVKLRKKRQRGNFIRRFYYKHLLKQWPPPEKPRKTLAAPPPPPPPVYDDSYNLVDLLQAHRAQLAHVYYGHKAVKYLPMIRRWGGPLVVSFHGMDVMPGAYKPGDPATLAEVFEYARLILGRSQSLLECLAALGCPREKLRLNRTAIPLEHLAASIRTVPPDGRWVLLQACRLIPKKGLTTTLDAMRRVVAERPGARLVIAGSGPMAGELQELIDQWNLADHVTLAGWCSQERLLALYRDAHLFLHPSEVTQAGDQEGVPNALLEAMATGLPVVATHHGGIPEAVTNGASGLLVPERAPDELAAAILRLTSDADLLHSLSIEAARDVEEKFASVRQLENLENWYEEALNASR